MTRIAYARVCVEVDVGFELPDEVFVEDTPHVTPIPVLLTIDSIDDGSDSTNSMAVPVSINDDVMVEASLEHKSDPPPVMLFDPRVVLSSTVDKGNDFTLQVVLHPESVDSQPQDLNPRKSRCIKADLRKAFDRVRWDYLQHRKLLREDTLVDILTLTIMSLTYPLPMILCFSLTVLHPRPRVLRSQRKQSILFTRSSGDLSGLGARPIAINVLLSGIWCVLPDRKKNDFITEVTWKPPPPGWIKINSDGSLGDDRFAYVAVVQDYFRNGLMALAARTRFASINVLELKGIAEGLKLCLRLGNIEFFASLSLSRKERE
ncbi:hypothetical protein QJS10_CPB12g00469 [Acorus calamus]|uniref:RNase H type-1 domain-containing protein n=1 Tax=Acorus calamus TaxID=4465 RepID=A0AAV9DJV3_ACOCL|nr:hypothetical protein QJS10_CPB12g00469 [Acorus calamus]